MIIAKVLPKLYNFYCNCLLTKYYYEEKYSYVFIVVQNTTVSVFVSVSDSKSCNIIFFIMTL